MFKFPVKIEGGDNMSNIIEVTRTVTIKESHEFQKKQLASHGMNVGLLCGHSCKYCSTPAVLRYNKVFKDMGMTSFQALQSGAAVVDPSTPARAAKDAVRLKQGDIVMLATTTDAYSPEAQVHGLGRSCAQAVLEHSQASLRILTKNAAVAKDLDLFEEHKDRIMLGLSVTAPASKEEVVALLEPNASKISERLDVYRQAKKLGLRSYGMLCPLLPGIASSYKDIHEMMETTLEFEPETIWLEPVNPWGDGLIQCRDALAAGGWGAESYRVDEIRSRELHQLYVDDLIDTATNVARDLGCLNKLKILVYSDGSGYCCNDEAVIWLKR